MQMGKLIILALVLVAAMAEGGKNSKMPKQTQITVTDLAGRQVKVTVPVEKVVLACARDLHEFAAIAGKDAIKKIVGMGPDLKLFDFDTYRKYKERFPEIESIPDIGYHWKGDFSVEKVISLKPDVVIFPLFVKKFEGVPDDIDKLQQAGIPSVFIDYLEKPFENTIPSTLLLGTLLGKEKRTQRIVDFYKNEVDKVISRLQKIDKPKPKVYVEGGGKGPSEYGHTSGTSSWGAIVIKAGGNNIAEGIIEGSAPINPEYLLKTNPDIIIITGSYWVDRPGAMRLGYYADPQESRELLKAFTERPGWDTLSAVKQGRVYSIFHPISHVSVYNFAALQAFAKWFYPDEFKDLDPEKHLKEFHRKFLPIKYSGVWMMGIKD